MSNTSVAYVLNSLCQGDGSRVEPAWRFYRSQPGQTAYEITIRRAVTQVNAVIGESIRVDPLTYPVTIFKSKFHLFQ
jgi:hypothetical protein